MGFSQDELDALRKAYATGALRVTHEGKSVEYGSQADLLQRIRFIEADLSASSGKKRGRRTVIGFQRG